jgi:hypothetical protein
MAQHNNSGVKAFTAGEALEAFRRVKLSAASGTQVEYADAGELGIGTTEEATASGDTVAVRLWNAPGTRKIVASAAAAEGDDLKGANDGKFGGATGTAMVTALGAASGDGSVIEALPD